MPFKKGDPKPPTSGRKQGASNKLTVALKDMILTSLAKAGGDAYLLRQSKKNPVAYLSLVGRVLPLQVKEGGADPQVPRKVIMELDEADRG